MNSIMESKIKIIFFGTPEIAVKSLQALHEHDSFEVVAVVTQEDKPVGRKQVMTPPEVKVYAEEQGLSVYQPRKLNEDDELYEELNALNPDYNVVVAYGQIMSQKWLDMPSKRSVNLHVSLLPKYRGAAPMQEAILRGDTMTGVTIQDMQFKMDTGDILGMSEIAIGPDDTFYDLYETGGEVGAELLVEILQRDFVGEITPIAQDESQASYCSKITKQDGYVDLAFDSAEEIYNKYRAYKMWPGVWTMKDGKRLKLTELAMQDGELHIFRVHPEGKKEMDYPDFLRGHTF